MVMSYEDWMRDTKRGLFTPRSSELGAIDTALHQYDTGGKTRPKLVDLKTALDAWIREKGAGWRNSTRNNTGTVETLVNQVNALLGPGGGIVVPARPALRPPPPVRAAGTSLTTPGLVAQYCQTVKAQVHVPWTTLDADTRASRMHAAVAALFPSMTVPAPGLNLVAALGGDAGRFDFKTWRLSVASGPFGGAAQPDRATFIDMAKTIYHEARHCEQWYHMARYAASGGLVAGDIADGLGIPRAVATQAVTRRMDARDGMFRLTKSWFESVYSRSGREITLTALGLQQNGDAALLANFRAQNHRRYAGDLPEEADAWGVEALLDPVYSWP